MIESEFEYKQYLRDIRGLAEGTCNSYPTYLAAITNHLHIDINRATVENRDAVKSILYKLKITLTEKNYWGNCQSALRAYLAFLQHEEITPITLPDEDLMFIEGASVEVKVNRYERDSKARSECIKYHGAICKVCKFDFYVNYGDIGKGFIHVHHVTPISQIGTSYKVNPVTDLVPVCPNCHAMLHTKKTPYSVKELQNKIVA
jgi:5-methylcytosine-specific restriction protein A